MEWKSEWMDEMNNDWMANKDLIFHFLVDILTPELDFLLSWVRGMCWIMLIQKTQANRKKLRRHTETEPNRGAVFVLLTAEWTLNEGCEKRWGKKREKIELSRLHTWLTQKSSQCSIRHRKMTPDNIDEAKHGWMDEWPSPPGTLTVASSPSSSLRPCAKKEHYYSLLENTV